MGFELFKTNFIRNSDFRMNNQLLRKMLYRYRKYKRTCNLYIL